MNERLDGKFHRMFSYLPCDSPALCSFCVLSASPLTFIINYLSLSLTSLWRSRLEFIKDKNIYKFNMSTTEGIPYTAPPAFPIFVNNTIISQSPK